MLLAVAVFAAGVLPELSRMIDFQRFETFDPNGPGLGNLFGQISPFTALGIWFSGDFRVAPGDGTVPAFAYYLAAALAAALLVHGLARCWRRRETAIVAGVIAVAGIYAAARAGGTPYTAAKALEVAAPLCALAILAPLLAKERGAWRVMRPIGEQSASLAGSGARRFRGTAIVAVLYLALAGGCSLLAFANAPVGPTSYSPALTGLRPLVANYATLVLAPEQLLEEEHGARYIVWELRGGRVCIRGEEDAGDMPPPGIRFVITTDSSDRPPFPDLTLRRRATPHLLWERRGVAGGPSPCPLIAVRQARQGPR